jgi:hypothetical protein
MNLFSKEILDGMTILLPKQDNKWVILRIRLRVGNVGQW